MWIQSSPLLHVVDTHTNFSAAQFLQGRDVESVWFAFLTCWASIYVGFPRSFLVNQGSVFPSERWAKIAAEAGIDIRFTPTESHNSLGPGERYHAPLRRIFLKIQMEFRNPKNSCTCSRQQSDERHLRIRRNCPQSTSLRSCSPHAVRCKRFA